MPTHNQVIARLETLAEEQSLYLYKPLAMLDGHKYYLRKLVDGRRTLATVCSSNDLEEIAVHLTGGVPAFMANYRPAQGGVVFNEILLGDGAAKLCVLSTCNFDAFDKFKQTQ